jgi:hypothetical protein
MLITLLGPRTRAPLGAKTTNAKAKGFQTPAGPALEKDLEKTQPKQSTRKPKKVTHAETTKIEVHGGESPLTEREVEYAPPKPKDLPYESDVFPDGCLNYDVLKPGNLMRGIYDVYHNPVDNNGKTRLEREHEESYAKLAKETDERILKMLDEDWTVDDVPETFRHIKKKHSAGEAKPKVVDQSKKSAIMSNKGPATITSRKAASALSVAPEAVPAAPKATVPKPRTSFLSRAKPAPAPAPTNASIRHASATAASRSTLGYTKGRSASSVLQKTEGGFQRSARSVSQESDATITPARFAQKEADQDSEAWRRLKFLEAFNADDEDVEPGLRGLLPESLRRAEEDDEEFVMPMPS